MLAIGADGTALTCGDYYTPGEELMVRVKYTSGSWCSLMELSGATFVDANPLCTDSCCKSDCDGTRQCSFSDTGVPWPIVASSNETITMKAGFAMGYGTVQVTQTCELMAMTNDTLIPTPMPTPVPTGMPSPSPTALA